MNKKIFIGIDNGVSGTIGVVGVIVDTIKTPVKSVLKYTKKKSNVTRIDHTRLKNYLIEVIGDTPTQEVIVALERPMVNPTRFTSTASALRAWEATLIVVEDLNLPYKFIDSKEWQKSLLPSGIKGSSTLKKASLQVGNRLFPKFNTLKHEDRDGLLIAEYIRTTY